MAKISCGACRGTGQIPYEVKHQHTDKNGKKVTTTVLHYKVCGSCGGLGTVSGPQH